MLFKLASGSKRANCGPLLGALLLQFFAFLNYTCKSLGQFDTLTLWVL